MTEAEVDEDVKRIFATKRPDPWRKRMEKAKSLHRPEIDWKKDRFAIDRLHQFLQFRDLPCAVNHVSDYSMLAKTPLLVDKVHCSLLSLQEFIDSYERPSLPCIIDGIPDQEEWLAVHKWNSQNKDYFINHLGKCMFKVGESDSGKDVKVMLKDFLKYMSKNDDDSPLKVFDGSFYNNEVASILLQDFKVPSYFQDDLFRLVGERRRPPYRWFLIGPARSGTCMHIDPLGTSAWNTLLQGRKRWVLMSPNTPKHVAKGVHLVRPGEDREAINYFVDIIPRIKETYGHMVNVIEFTQNPMETVFIPGGWWHAVLNLEDTIAVTQNFCSQVNFEYVWCKTRVSRPKLAMKWYKLLSDRYPHLVAAMKFSAMPSKSSDIHCLTASRDSDDSSCSSSYCSSSSASDVSV